ncbi:YSIRK-type signal peptide-containing protein [Babesia caballi]|uniref:YSIRK-type signal peptide-containing protein n=1 Tax=Babesia caballi TaxID=5871 RepID=A0AAV4LT23_BABCB|nr:YSIRK-type signal peptide-containing protein [Babesia caballi]
MKTPTRKNLLVPETHSGDLTYATESRSFSVLSRSSNPFYKATEVEDDPLRQCAGCVCSSEALNTPSWRQKRSSQREISACSSFHISKRFRQHHTTPVVNGAFCGDVSLTSDAGGWKHRSSLLAKLSDQQQKADKALGDISLLLREVDKCNMHFRELRLRL